MARILRITVALLLVAVLGAGIAGGLWFERTILADLPTDLTEYRDWRPLTNVTVLDADGQPIDRFYAERRAWVALDSLPDHVWQAFVAAEDRRFFEHPGVDALGIARALVGNLVAGETRSGASTLTQQLVKNLLVGSERSVERKLREAVLAGRLERDVGKRRILELYVNYVALGSGNYGIEAAAQDYFGIPAADLDVGQAALIAGLVPAPSRYSPRRAPEVAAQRRALVLGRMVKAGYLAEDDVQRWLDAPVTVPARRDGQQPVHAAYLTSVRRSIRHLFGSQAPFQAGLTVTTPLRPALQRVAVQAVDDATRAHVERQGPLGVRSVQEGLPPDADAPCFLAAATRGRRGVELATATRRWQLAPPDARVHTETGPRPLRDVLVPHARVRICPVDDATARLDPTPWAQAAAVVVHWRTGEVVAIAGGRDVALEGFDRATQARRQPGSSFKPYVYAAAFATVPGVHQLTERADTPVHLGDWSPKNYGGGQAGVLSLREALARSTNTIPVHLTQALGRERLAPTRATPVEEARAGARRVADTARALGVQTPLDADITLPLGTAVVTPLDQAMGYAGLLRGGAPVEPVWIRSVRTVDGGPFAKAGETLALPDGPTLQLPGAPGPRAVPDWAAYQVVDMLREVVRSGTARRVHDPLRDRGAKTGTTNDFVDAWLVGFTAEHVIAVWVGTDDTRSLGDGETGGKAALPAWRALADALDEAPGARVEPPGSTWWRPWRGQEVALPLHIDG